MRGLVAFLGVAIALAGCEGASEPSGLAFSSLTISTPRGDVSLRLPEDSFGEIELAASGAPVMHVGGQPVRVHEVGPDRWELVLSAEERALFRDALAVEAGMIGALAQAEAAGGIDLALDEVPVLAVERDSLGRPVAIDVAFVAEAAPELAAYLTDGNTSEALRMHGRVTTRVVPETGMRPLAGGCGGGSSGPIVMGRLYDCNVSIEQTYTASSGSVRATLVVTREDNAFTPYYEHFARCEATGTSDAAAARAACTQAAAMFEARYVNGTPRSCLLARDGDWQVRTQP